MPPSQRHRSVHPGCQPGRCHTYRAVMKSKEPTMGFRDGAAPSQRHRSVRPGCQPGRCHTYRLHGTRGMGCNKRSRSIVSLYDLPLLSTRRCCRCMRSEEVGLQQGPAPLLHTHVYARPARPFDLSLPCLTTAFPTQQPSSQVILVRLVRLAPPSACSRHTFVSPLLPATPPLALPFPPLL